MSDGRASHAGSAPLAAVTAAGEVLALHLNFGTSSSSSVGNSGKTMSRLDDGTGTALEDLTSALLAIASVHGVNLSRAVVLANRRAESDHMLFDTLPTGEKKGHTDAEAAALAAVAAVANSSTGTASPLLPTSLDSDFTWPARWVGLELLRDAAAFKPRNSRHL